MNIAKWTVITYEEAVEMVTKNDVGGRRMKAFGGLFMQMMSLMVDDGYFIKGFSEDFEDEYMAELERARES